MKGYSKSVKMAHVEFKRPKKKIISAEEKRREKNSLKSYNIYGGDDAS